MNSKGQALVEFILILPIFLIILLSLIDIGSIFVKKYELSDDAEIISNMYINDKEKMMAYIAKEDIEYSENANGDLVTIILEKNIKINAPILSNVIGKNYKIKVSKTIYGVQNEQ